MTLRLRYGFFLAGAAGLAALLLWAAAGLPSFGDYKGPYGKVLNRVVVGERHTTEVVTAVVFDYRGLDTMGEEFILFASAIGVVLLLRDVRERRTQPKEEVRSDAVRAAGLILVPAVFLLGLYVVAHGYITPGGGFQGGVVLAAAIVLVYLAAEYRAFRRIAPLPVVDFVEGTGAGGYVVVGLAALLLGSAFLHNLLSLGTAGTLASSGSIPMLNVASALEVAAAFLLVFTEFLEELIERLGEERP
jgi:multicomponent Na+:H+ antiporter subunit B